MLAGLGKRQLRLRAGVGKLMETGPVTVEKGHDANVNEDVGSAVAIEGVNKNGI
jgi:hypothetical protein